MYYIFQRQQLSGAAKGELDHFAVLRALVEYRQIVKL
jgi:hypothetical protein